MSILNKIKDSFRIINMSAELGQKNQNNVGSDSDKDPWVHNILFDELINLSDKSATHKSILTTKINLVGGTDVSFDGVDIFPNSDESYHELIKKLTPDLEVFGACAILYMKMSDGITYNLSYIKLDDLRFSKKNEKGKIEGMYYSKHWNDTKKYKPIYIPFFIKNSTENQQLMLIKREWVGNDYDIKPSYFGALNYIKIDDEIGNFHLANIQSGLNPGLIVDFYNGQPSPAQAEQIINNFLAQYGGTKNTANVMFNFNNDKETKIDVKQLETSDLHNMFTVLTETTSQQILTAHQLTNPQLAGIKTPGELGGGGAQLLQSSELFYTNVIRPDQILIEDGINKLLQGNNTINIVNQSNLKFGFSENLLSQVLTTNEIREMLGYPELEVEVDKSAEIENQDLNKQQK